MKTAKRGDLVVIHTATRIAHQHGADQATQRYELAVVTSITREHRIKAVRVITGRDAAAGKTTPIRVDRLPRHGMVVLPAAQLRVSDALAAVIEQRADAESGYLPAYDNPADLLRDVHPWIIGDTACLADLRGAAYTYQIERADQRCDDCGVTTHGEGRIDVSGIAATVHCQPACPVGVNFTTDYPVGLEVRITDGFAAGAITRIERVSDSAVADRPNDETSIRYYVGRSYAVTLPFWGYRLLVEEIFQPVDPQLTSRYAVRREALTS